MILESGNALNAICRDPGVVLTHKFRKHFPQATGEIDRYWKCLEDSTGQGKRFFLVARRTTKAAPVPVSTLSAGPARQPVMHRGTPDCADARVILNTQKSLSFRGLFLRFRCIHPTSSRQYRYKTLGEGVLSDYFVPHKGC